MDANTTREADMTIAEIDAKTAAAVKRQADRVKFYNRARRRGLAPDQAMNVTRAHFGDEG